MAYLKLKKDSVKILDNIKKNLCINRTDYIIEVFFKSVLESIEILDEIVNIIDNTSINELSNEVIYDWLCKLYDIHFYNTNYLEFFSDYYNKKFVGFKWINTTMVRRFKIHQYDKEKGQLLKIDNKTVSILLKVAYTSDLELIDGYQYSVSEINEMSIRNKIVILSEGTECIDFGDVKNEPYHKFDEYKMDDSISPQNMFFLQMMKNLKQTLYFQLPNDLKEYMKEIKSQINKVLEYKNYNTAKYKLIGEQCRMVLEQQGLYQQIEDCCKKYSKY